MRRSAFLSLALTVVCGSLAAQNSVAVVNGASFLARFPVAPGSLASAFGTFPGASSASASALPLPATLGGVQVLVDDTPAPLLFVSAAQVNFQVPRSVATGRRSVRVTVGGTAVAQGTMDLLDLSPGIFITGTAGNNPVGAVLNQNSSANTEANPARRGEVIQIFGTGPGALSATIADGAAAPGDPVVTTTTQPVAGVIGGVETAADFSGMAPGFVGLWQVNVKVPDRSFISGQVQLFVKIGGLPTNVVTFWVAP
jgi:uncharacterized protein (TIGR03437 family)